MTPVNDHVFREYDVRGLVGDDLTADVAEQLGRAFGSEIIERGDGAADIAVGYDNRPSSPPLAEAFGKGLVAAGARVLAVGMVPTPGLYFAAHHLDADAGVQVTGSHNPPEYNGFKMLSSAGPFYGDDIRGLRARIQENRYREGQGEIGRHEVLEKYIADVAGRFDLARPVHVVIDCGNGTGSLAAVEILERAGARVEALYCDSDGTFPNHHPDPTVDDNLRDLIGRVRESEAELGVAFDGDADRIGAVDEDGKIIRGDYLLLIYALDALRSNPGQQIIFDVKCSQVLEEKIGEAGGRPIMWKTGHSLIKKKMKETGARVAGEMSGHMFFADDYYGYDDALYAACRLVDIVARWEQPVSAALAELPSYPSTPELRIECSDEAKFRIVRDAVAHFEKSHEVIDVDGARIKFDGGWGLIRASNTQPVIVARFEADDQDRLQAIQAEVFDWLREQGISV